MDLSIIINKNCIRLLVFKHLLKNILRYSFNQFTVDVIKKD